MATITVFQPNEIMMIGLRIFFTSKRINNVRGDPMTSRTNIKRFKGHYGADPFVIAQIWEDLQTTKISDARVENPSLFYFLEALHFLYRYKREIEREGTFDRSPKTLRKWCWHYVKKIQQLKQDKVVFPEFCEDDIIVLTVDGVHCLANEPMHTIFSQDVHYYSHKKNHAGFCYELGISLFEPKLIWMNGPFPAGPNDNKNFAEKGLKQKLSEIGKKGLGDKIYNGHPDECSTFNAFDDPVVKQFKSRAQMRHEQFNGMMKEFSCLDGRFRHKEAKFGACFEAVAVICQYRMENGEPLFDLMAGLKFDDDNSDMSGNEELEDDDGSESEDEEDAAHDAWPLEE